MRGRIRGIERDRQTDRQTEKEINKVGQRKKHIHRNKGT